MQAMNIWIIDIWIIHILYWAYELLIIVYIIIDIVYIYIQTFIFAKYVNCYKTNQMKIANNVSLFMIIIVYTFYTQYRRQLPICCVFTVQQQTDNIVLL